MLKEYNINTSNAYIKRKVQQQVQVHASLMEAPSLMDEGQHCTEGI